MSWIDAVAVDLMECRWRALYEEMRPPWLLLTVALAAWASLVSQSIVSPSTVRSMLTPMGVVQLCSSGDDGDAFADGAVAVVRFLTSCAVLEDAMRCLDNGTQCPPWSTRMISGVTPIDVVMGVGGGVS